MAMGALFFHTPPSKLEIYNLFFYGTFFFGLCFSLLIKNNKSALFLLLIVMLYISANKTYSLSALVNIKLWLLIIIPLNLLLIFQMPDKNFSVFGPLVFFLFEGTLIENLYLLNILDLPFIFSLLSGFFWAGVFCYMLIKISYAPTLTDNSLFFSSILVFFALANYSEHSSRIFCLAGAAFMVGLSSVLEAVYSYYKDTVTGVYSVHSFKKHDKNSNNQYAQKSNNAYGKKGFPPKYTLTFFYIDNYNKILKVFGQKQTDILTMMVLKRIEKLELNALTYRLKPSEFCFVFSDLDVKEAYEKMEEVRRLIAGTEFVLPSQKIVKITITPAVSEKRRSDKNAEEVLNRMYEMFYPRYRFTQNMTFCEEIEKTKKYRRV